jgi:hypothetical protein
MDLSKTPAQIMVGSSERVSLLVFANTLQNIFHKKSFTKSVLLETNLRDQELMSLTSQIIENQLVPYIL